MFKSRYNDKNFSGVSDMSKLMQDADSSEAEVHIATPPHLVYKFEHCSIYLNEDQTYKGYCLLVYNKPAFSIEDIPALTWMTVSQDIAKAVAAIKYVCKPDSVNVATLENICNRITWHLVPRYINDPKWGRPIWSGEKVKETKATCEELATLSKEIKKYLQEFCVSKSFEELNRARFVDKYKSELSAKFGVSEGDLTKFGVQLQMFNASNVLIEMEDGSECKFKHAFLVENSHYYAVFTEHNGYHEIAKKDGLRVVELRY